MVAVALIFRAKSTTLFVNSLGFEVSPTSLEVSTGLAVWPEDDKSVHLNKLPKGKEIEIDISQNLVTWEMVDFLKDLFCHERITMQKSSWRNSIDLFFCK